MTTNILESTQQKDPESPTLSKRVLIVEDDESLHPIYQIKLEVERDYHVSFLTSAEEALARLDGIDPDIVLLDYSLGGEMNGLDALRRLRDILPELPVVMLTGVSNSEELRGECIRRGGYDLFSKPVLDWDLLDFRIQKALVHAAELQKMMLLAVADDAKRAFLRLIGHEFGTPMTPLISGLYELLDPEIRTGEDAQEIVADALAGAERLNELIGSILDIVEIRDGRMQLSIEPIQLAEVIASAIDIIWPRAEDKGLDITLDISPTVKILADYSNLQRVFMLLLENAVKFTQQGRISVKTWEEEKYVLASVTDTGCGIAEKKLKGIFRLFNQVNDSISNHTDGAGIGLTMAQELLRLQQASISVDSVEGEGSTFTVKFLKDREE